MQLFLNIKQKRNLLLAIFIAGLMSLGCGFVDPIKEKIAQIGSTKAPSKITLPTKTARPTFTATPNWTPTPTVTLTPTPTRTPTETSTPTETPTPTETAIPTGTATVAPTNTPTPAPPTNTPKPRPPTNTPTPAPPTPTPTPDFPFKVVEGPQGYPTSNPILVMYIALTDANNTPIGGLKVVGDHTPTGDHWVSGESCFDFCKVNGLEGTLKFGNVTFEPPRYETGVWNLYVVDGAGNQVSNVIPVTVDFNAPGWFFLMLRK